MAEPRSEIAFFDVETRQRGQGSTVIEFGAILVCPKKLVELKNYTTLICPEDRTLINSMLDRPNGITRAAVSSAPPFSDVADKIFDLLHGRIWVGHNILRHDCPLIRKAFAEIGRSPPEPKWTIDSLDLLTETFGPRAGNMKMDNLANYFGLGQQTHRSLDDVRLNFEVLKYCATVLFLESSLPNILASDSLGFHSNQTLGEQILQYVEPNRPEIESFNGRRLPEYLMDDTVQEDNAEPQQTCNLSTIYEGCSSSSTFLTPDDVIITSINAYHGSPRIQILHGTAVLKLHCINLKVRHGIRIKYRDQAGRPSLSFVVDAPPSVCQVLEACDHHAQNSFLKSSSTSVWRPVVNKKNFPTIRLRIPTVVTGGVARYGTEIFQREAYSGGEQKLDFSNVDAAEYENLFTAGSFIDAFFSLDTYDYKDRAGIRLVTEKLVSDFGVHTAYI